MNAHPFGRLWTDMKLVIVILFIVQFARGAALASFIPIYGGRTLSLSTDIIGAAISAHYLTDTLLKLVLGYLLDRFSPRRIVQFTLLLSLAGIYALQFATLPWLFIGAAALYGVGMSPIWMMCLMKVSAGQRGQQMGFLYTVWLLGLGSGPILCNILLDYSNMYTSLLLVSLSVLACGLTFFMPQEPLLKPALIPLRKQLVILKLYLHRMRLLLPGMILQTVGASMLIPILPIFASDQLGLSGAQYSVLLAAGGIGAVAGLVPMGKLADWAGRKRLFLVGGFTVFAIGMYLLAQGLSFWYCLFIAIGLGLSYAAILPSWNSLLASLVPPRQPGVGWGLLSTFEGIGVMIGPLAGGAIALWGGETAVFWMCSALFALLGVFYATIKQNGV